MARRRHRIRISRVVVVYEVQVQVTKHGARSMVLLLWGESSSVVALLLMLMKTDGSRSRKRFGGIRLAEPIDSEPSSPTSSHEGHERRHSYASDRAGELLVLLSCFLSRGSTARASGAGAGQ